MADKDKWMEVLGRLGNTDRNAARFGAFLLASSDDLNGDVRRMFLAIALGTSESEVERCAEVLAAEGLGKIRWWN